MPDLALASRLLEARTSLGLSEEEAAAKLRWGVTLLRGFEGGSYAPTNRELKRLAEAYGRTAAWLREGDGDAG
jgi:transcriptional regulator with XRE-family HTH domain